MNHPMVGWHSKINVAAAHNHQPAKKTRPKVR